MTLANVTGIHVLNFAQNELEQIETGAFDNLKELRALRLDHNYLADINGLVSGRDFLIDGRRSLILELLLGD